MIDAANHDGLAFDTGPAFWLLCRMGMRCCALPLSTVTETMRPLPVEPLAGGPRFVRGLSIVRGSPVPVVDAASLFDERDIEPRRWVTVGVQGRIVALAVQAVLGIRSISASPGHELPPLLRDAVGEVVSAIGMLDAELLLFLNAARIVPEAWHASLLSGEAAR